MFRNPETYFIGDASRHRRDEDDATTVAKPEHLLSRCLRSEQDSACIDIQYLYVRISMQR